MTGRRQRLVRYAKARGTAIGDLLEVMFPDIPPDSREYLLWEFTGWPGFFRTRDAVSCLVAQLLNVRRALNYQPHQRLEYSQPGTRITRFNRLLAAEGEHGRQGPHGASPA